jgi:ribonuclease HII
MKKIYHIWVDEAGRWPWAWPVVAGGFLCETWFDFGQFSWKINDSKKIQEKNRENLFSDIERIMGYGWCRYTFSYRDAEVIDSIGIREANRQCMEEVIIWLLQYIEEEEEIHIHIDGCDNYIFGVDNFEYIFAKKKEWRKINIWNPKTIEYIIHGDALIPEISCASIVAKVTRDRMMCDFHEDFPLYWFDSHKGYGTSKHHLALLNYGITPIHRKSYAPVKKLILGDFSL